MRTSIIVGLAALCGGWGVGCCDCDDDDPAVDAGVDAAADSDSDGDTDGDADTDSDADSEWEQLADIPTGGAFVSVGVIDGRIHALPSGSDQHFVYDPELDEWETLAAAPAPAHHHEAAAAAGKLYRFGGYWGSASQDDYMDDNFVYDPELDTWDTAAPMTVPRPYSTAAVIGDLIYVVGGPNIGGETYHLMNEAYDPGSDEWSARADLPSSVTWTNYGALVAVDGAIYKFGGGGSSAPLATALEYDPGADEWTPLTAMPAANHGVAGAAIGGNVYLLGGAVDLVTTDEVLIYSVADDAYSAGPALPEARQYHVAASVGSCVYSIGGTNTFAPEVETSVIRYCE